MPENHPTEPGPALFEAGFIVHSDAACNALEAAHGPNALSHERPAGTMPGSEYLNRHFAGDFGEVGRN